LACNQICRIENKFFSLRVLCWVDSILVKYRWVNINSFSQERVEIISGLDLQWRFRIYNFKHSFLQWCFHQVQIIGLCAYQFKAVHGQLCLFFFDLQKRVWKFYWAHVKVEKTWTNKNFEKFFCSQQHILIYKIFINLSISEFFLISFRMKLKSKPLNKWLS